MEEETRKRLEACIHEVENQYPWIARRDAREICYKIVMND